MADINVTIEDAQPINVTLGGAVNVYRGGGAEGGVQSVVAGENIAVDNTDPANPVVSSTASGGGGGGGAWVSAGKAELTSASGRLDVSGLNLEQDKIYRFIVYVPEVLATVPGVFYVNNDKTSANYSSQATGFTFGVGAVTTGNRWENTLRGFTLNKSALYIEGMIVYSTKPFVSLAEGGGQVTVLLQNFINTGGYNNVYIQNHIHKTATNLTTFSFSSDWADTYAAYPAGTTLEVFKRV